MNLRPLVLPLAFAAALVAVPAAAQHNHHGTPSAKPAAGTSAKEVVADGDVRKIDRAKGTITLRHGPLEALGMGPMTMVFAAADPKLLANVKEGDKVRFVPVQGKDGQLQVTKIEVVK